MTSRSCGALFRKITRRIVILKAGAAAQNGEKFGLINPVRRRASKPNFPPRPHRHSRQILFFADLFDNWSLKWRVGVLFSVKRYRGENLQLVLFWDDLGIIDSVVRAIDVSLASFSFFSSENDQCTEYSRMPFLWTFEFSKAVML